MVILTKLDGTQFVVNAKLIETVEAKPDTTIKTRDKNYYIVRETISEVIDAVIAYDRKANELSRLRIELQGNEADIEMEKNRKK